MFNYARILGALTAAWFITFAAAPAEAQSIRVRDASIGPNQTVNSSAPWLANFLRNECNNKAICNYTLNSNNMFLNSADSLSVEYDCGNGTAPKTETLHLAKYGYVLRLNCYWQYSQDVDNFSGPKTPFLPNFYSSNQNGKNIGAMAAKVTSSSPMGLINSAYSTYKSLAPVPNPYAEIGMTLMNALVKPDVKY